MVPNAHHMQTIMTLAPPPPGHDVTKPHPSRRSTAAPPNDSKVSQDYYDGRIEYITQQTKQTTQPDNKAPGLPTRATPPTNTTDETNALSGRGLALTRAARTHSELRNNLVTHRRERTFLLLSSTCSFRGWALARRCSCAQTGLFEIRSGTRPSTGTWAATCQVGNETRAQKCSKLHIERLVAERASCGPHVCRPGFTLTLPMTNGETRSKNAIFALHYPTCA